ncbi:MAG: tetratricopeptide repeat protein [Bacteroidetes bacterium]|nr:tetratricopeptide repeat protein [Bacteroidota bacterium]
MNLKVKKIFIWLLIIYCNSILIGQNKDSLKTEIKNAKHDTTRCKLLSMLIENEYDEKIWPAYNEKLFELAKKNVEAQAPGKLKNAYLTYFANATNNKGYLAQEHGDISKALEYYFSALKLEEQLGDKKNMATTINNIAYIYMHQGGVERSLEYVNKALELQKEIKDSNGIANSYNNLGNLYRNKNDIERSLEYFERSLEIQKKLNNINGVAVCLSNIGDIYTKKGEPKISVDYYLQAMKINAETNDKDAIAYNLNCLANLMYSMGRSEEALNYGLKGYTLAKEVDYIENIRNASYILYKIYKKQNNYPEALKMYQSYITMRDSLNNTETRRSSIKNQLKYEYEKKAAADSVRVMEEKKVIAVQLKHERTQRYFLYGGLSLTMLFGIFMLNRFRVTKKQKNIINEQKILVEKQKLLVEEKQKEVLDSIHYAKRIQTSLLPNENYLKKHIPKT